MIANISRPFGTVPHGGSGSGGRNSRFFSSHLPAAADRRCPGSGYDETLSVNGAQTSLTRVGPQSTRLSRTCGTILFFGRPVSDPTWNCRAAFDFKGLRLETRVRFGGIGRLPPRGFRCVLRFEDRFDPVVTIRSVPRNSPGEPNVKSEAAIREADRRRPRMQTTCSKNDEAVTPIGVTASSISSANRCANPSSRPASALPSFGCCCRVWRPRRGAFDFRSTRTSPRRS